MQNGEDAEALLEAALSLPFKGPASMVVPGENIESVALLQRYGFRFRRVNRHMGRGAAAPAGRREQVFGQASLSLGKEKHC